MHVCDMDECCVAGDGGREKEECLADEWQGLRSQRQAKLTKLSPQLPQGLMAKATCQGSTLESLKILPSVPAMVPAHGGMPHPS